MYKIFIRMRNGKRIFVEWSEAEFKKYTKILSGTQKNKYIELCSNKDKSMINIHIKDIELFRYKLVVM